MINLTSVIEFLHVIPSEWVLCMLYGLASLALGLLYRLFGRAGVYIFVALSVILANIQALKAMQLSFFPQPIAMGTTLFMTTFLATDLLAEQHGAASAQKAVWIGFASVIFTTTIMLMTLGITPVNDPAHPHFYQAHRAIATLFMPAPALFTASLIAYLTSQFLDVRLFLVMKKITKGHYLWLRALLSTALSSLLDTIIFSVLAWKIFTPLTISIKTLIFTYILGTYIMRLVLSGLNVPLLYSLKRIKIPHND